MIDTDRGSSTSSQEADLSHEFSPVEQAVFARITRELTDEYAMRAAALSGGEDYDEQRIAIVKIATGLAGSYKQGRKRIEGIYEQREYVVNNLFDYADAVADEKGRILRQIQEEIKATPDDSDLLEALREAGIKLAGAQYLQDIIKNVRRQAATNRVGIKGATNQPVPMVQDATGSSANRTVEIDNIERARERALLSKAVVAARGTVRIETSVLTTSPLRFKSGDAPAPADGFTLFGDGVDVEKWSPRERSKYIPAEDSPEAMIFEPDTQSNYHTTVKIVKTGLFGKTRRIEEQVFAGEVPVMAVNQLTGLEEPGVIVRYQFDANTGYDYNPETRQAKGYPPYKSPEEYGRAGNYLFVEVTLAQSTARELKEAVLRNPSIIRQYVQALLTENGATVDTMRMPPYTELPEAWTIAVADMHKEDRSHHIASREDLII